MIFDLLEFVLTPIIFLMAEGLNLINGATGSLGISIMLLSCFVTLVSFPLWKWGGGVERGIIEKKKKIDQSVKAKAAGKKGEERFRVVEDIYREYGYHPIQSAVLGLSFFVTLPFLLSALFLLVDNNNLSGVTFLLIEDLSEPDSILFGLNVLPMIMTGITLVDAKIRFSNDRGMFLRFSAIAIVLFGLVYFLPSALVLYWIVSNFVSMIVYLFGG